jgi:hypothetical protein
MQVAIAMRRREWIEFHDHRLYPGFLRDLLTDALEAIWNYTNCYRVIVPRLRLAMTEAGTHRIVDLCSGGGGPWIRLREQFVAAEGFEVSVSLTDKYPNERAFTRLCAAQGVESYRAPVDARQIPVNLDGFRTIFSAFHHFKPDEARAILADAVMRHQGIAVFEPAKCSVRRILATTVLPLLCWLATPRMKPFHWSRILWTYLLPVVPFTLFIDGVLSCLRAYSLEDLRQLTEGLGGDEYRWEMGEQGGGRIGITYLIGIPVNSFRAEEQFISAVSVGR